MVITNWFIYNEDCFNPAEEIGPNYTCLIKESKTAHCIKLLIMVYSVNLDHFVIQSVLIYRAFEECHKVIDPENFFKACVYDVCHMQNGTGCFSLETYAHMCADEYVCVDWRGLTNGQCGTE